MSVVASPTQQGVIANPQAAHLRTNVLNGKLRIASSTNSTGGQPAVYHITGGAITNNVNLSLPNLTSDDTIATQSDNITWTGAHTFQQGLVSNGPITTNSTLYASKMYASGDLQTDGNISTQGTVSSNTLVNSYGDLAVAGNGTVAGDHTIGGNHSVTGTSTLTGAVTVHSPLTNTSSSSFTGNITISNTALVTAGAITMSGLHTIQSSGNLIHSGSQMQLTPVTSYGTTGHIFAVNQFGGNDASWFGVQVGTTRGIVIGTQITQRVGFFNVAGVGQALGGAKTITSTYGSTEASALAIAYGTLRNLGLIS